jgi:hypothetical protein
MTHQQDGDDSFLSMGWTEIRITKYFPTKEDAVSFAEKVHTNAAQDEIWLSTTTMTQVGLEDSCATTVTITLLDGLSETILEKLEDLLNT